MVFTQFLAVVAKPVIGFITDYINKLKLVLFVLVVFQGLFFFLFLILPAIPKEANITSFRAFLNCSGSKVNYDHETFIDYLNCYEFIRHPSDCMNTSRVTFKNNEVSVFDLCNFNKSKIDLNQSDNSSIKTENNEMMFEVSVNDSSLRIYQKVFPKENITSFFNQSCVKYLPCSKISNELFILLCNSTILFCHEEHSNSSIGLLVENNVHEASSKNRSDFQTYQFWAFLVVFALFCTCKSSTITLSDTACCECAQKKGADYGKQRLYGAVGWGLFAPIAGYLNDYTNDYLTTGIFFTVLSL
ncbi:major facilitator superfamily domain-containing protein 6, partial [Nephila pilipes]